MKQNIFRDDRAWTAVPYRAFQAFGTLPDFLHSVLALNRPSHIRRAALAAEDYAIASKRRGRSSANKSPIYSRIVSPKESVSL